MKIEEEPVDEVKEALVAFFDREGGYTQVAKKIGGNPQQLHYIVTGRNAPTLKTVMRILRFYPNEVELRRALSLPVLTQVAPQSGQAPAFQPDQEDWKGRFEALEAKYDALLERYNKLVDVLMSKLTPSFNWSGNHPTAEQIVDRMIVEGFRPNTDAKVIALNSVGNVRPMYGPAAA